MILSFDLYVVIAPLNGCTSIFNREVCREERVLIVIIIIIAIVAHVALAVAVVFAGDCCCFLWWLHLCCYTKIKNQF